MLTTPRPAFADADDLDLNAPYDQVPVIVLADYPSDGHVEVSSVRLPNGTTRRVPTGLLLEIA